MKNSAVDSPRANLASRAAPMALLPFLDIIFGTVGILVVVFALQNAVKMLEGMPPSVDSVVTCIGGDYLKAHWPDGSIGPVEKPQRSFELLQMLASDGRPFRSMILVLSGSCYEARRDFLDGFERYVAISKEPIMANGRPRGGLLLELYPIGDEADATALLEKWREDFAR